MILNGAALWVLALVLLMAFYFQVFENELPCPLCLLQRAGFIALAIGPALNIRYGPRSSHYGITVLFALLGGGFALRQVLLHIEPGNPGYGEPMLGLHYYTWAFIMFVAAIAACALMLDLRERGRRTKAHAFGHIGVWLVIVVATLNIVSTVLECGFEACPANPTDYKLLQG